MLMLWKRKVPRYSRKKPSQAGRPAVSSSWRKSKYPFSYGTVEYASSGSMPRRSVRSRVSSGRAANRSSEVRRSCSPAVACISDASRPYSASRMRRSA